MPNLSQFKKGLRDASRKEFPSAVKKAQANLAGRIYSGVVLKTPVLTGHARHNCEELEGVFGGDTTGDAFTETEVIKMRRVQKQIESAPLGEAEVLEELNSKQVDLNDSRD